MSAERPYTPVPVVEVAFGFGIYIEPGPGDWTDITEDVFEISVQRGRSSELSQFNAGTATVSVYNDARQYEPPGAGLVAGTPIRILADLGGVLYPVWRGFVDAWPVEYSDGGFRSELAIPCTDAFKALGQRPMPDTLEQDLDSLSVGVPQNWLRMDVAAPRLPNYSAAERSFLLQTTLSTTDGLGRASSTGVSVPALTPGSGAKGYAAVLPRKNSDVKWNMTTGLNWSVSLLVQFSDRGSFPASTFVDLYYTTTDPNSNAVAVALTVEYVTGRPRFAFADGSIVQELIPAAGTVSAAGVPVPDVMDGNVHHLVGVRSGTTAQLYVDGLLVASKTGTASGFGVANFNYLGGTPIGDGVKRSAAFVLDEVMTWSEQVVGGGGLDYTLTAAEVVSLNRFLMKGFAGDDPQLSGAQVEAVLDRIGWPASLRDIDPGETVVRLPGNLSGGTALDLLQLIAETEGARLFIDREGRIAFHDRTYPTAATLEVSSDESDTGAYAPVDGSVRLRVDDQHDFQAVTVTREGGYPQTVTAVNPPERTRELSGLLLETDAEALNVAQRLLFESWGLSLGVALRAEGFVIDGESEPALWADLLDGAEIGSRCDAWLAPNGESGDPIELTEIVERVDHEISTEQWLVTIGGVPFAADATWFEWGGTGATEGWGNGWWR